jgi:hypothetical protein
MAKELFWRGINLLLNETNMTNFCLSVFLANRIEYILQKKTLFYFYAYLMTNYTN